nr:hypothetical protein [uncultured bacterium]
MKHAGTQDEVREGIGRIDRLLQVRRLIRRAVHRRQTVAGAETATTATVVVTAPSAASAATIVIVLIVVLLALVTLLAVASLGASTQPLVGMFGLDRILAVSEQHAGQWERRPKPGQQPAPGGGRRERTNQRVERIGVHETLSSRARRLATVGPSPPRVDAADPDKPLTLP